MAYAQKIFADKVCDGLSQINGVLVYNNPNHSRAAHGWPNIYVCTARGDFWIYVKKDDFMLWAPQILVYDHLISHGVNIFRLIFTKTKMLQIKNFKGQGIGTVDLLSVVGNNKRLAEEVLYIVENCKAFRNSIPTNYIKMAPIKPVGEHP